MTIMLSVWNVNRKNHDGVAMQTINGYVYIYIMLHPVLKVEDDSKFVIHNKGYTQSGYFKGKYNNALQIKYLTI